MSKVFKALGDETRRSILVSLNAHNMNVGEIVEQYNMSQPAITNHLDILKGADLIESTKAGRNVIYSINKITLVKTLRDFLEIFE